MRRLVLMISVGLNLWLGYRFLNRDRTAPIEPPPAPTTRSSAKRSAPTSPGNSAAILADTNQPSQEAGPPFTWNDLATNDLFQLVRNLRAVGCPESAVQSLVAQELNQEFASEENKLWSKGDFWQSPKEFFRAGTNRLHQLTLLKEKQKNLILEILGSDWNQDAFETFVADAYSEFQLGFLSQDRALQVTAANQGVDLSNWETRIAYGTIGVMLEKDLEPAALGVRKILNPDEWEEYALRMAAGHYSALAALGEDPFPGLELSGEEYRQIIKITFKEFLSPAGMTQLLGMGSVENEPRTLEKEKAIQELLGEDRFARFIRSEDFFWQTALETASETGQPPEVAARCYEIKKAAEAELKVVSQNNSLTDQERARMKVEIRKTTEKALRSLVGDQVFEEHLVDAARDSKIIPKEELE